MKHQVRADSLTAEKMKCTRRAGLTRGGLGGLAALLVLTGCGDEPPIGIVPDSPADLQETLAVIPAWAQISAPVTPSVDQEVGDATGEKAALQVTDPRHSPAHFCTTEPRSLGRNHDDVMALSPDEGLWVPGVLLQGRSHIVGQLQQLSIVERAPIELVINQSGVGNPARRVDAPSLSSLRAAANDLIQDAETSGFAHGTFIGFRRTDSHATRQSALALGVSLRYLNAEAEGQLTSNSTATTSTVTASFVQNAFSIRADGPLSADDWFTDDFTQERLDQLVASGHIGLDNPPLYVQSVTYGRIVTVNFTSQASRSEIRAILNASYDNGFTEWEANLSSRERTIVQNADIQIVALGGPADGGFQFAKEILSPGDPTAIGLDGFFAQDVSLTTFVPISFTVVDLRTGDVATVGEITEYERLDCGLRLGSDFEGGLQGWTAEDERYLARVSGEAHSGAGYLRVEEGNTGVTYLRAPDSYLGNKRFYSGGELSFWTRWDQCVVDRDGLVPTPLCNGTGSGFDPEDWPDVSIESATSPKILVFQAGPADFAEDTWVRRSITLSPDATARVYNPTAGETIADAAPASQEDIDEVLTDISRLRIRGEHRGGAYDTVWLDDVRWSHELEVGG